MARLSLLSRFRRGGGEPGQSEPPRPRRSAPSAGVLRRERRALVRAREERIRDLGGLILEMYRRDRFREDLLTEQCAELVTIEARLHELDSLLSSPHALLTAARCACGAPVFRNSHFCPSCGRPTGGVPVAVCAACGYPLPADARFCGACGRPGRSTGSGAGEAAPEPVPSASGDIQPASATEDPAHPPDPWES